MNSESYYRDHWIEVAPERLTAYEEMFRWRPQMEPLLEPASLQPGQTVVDYGCGPGLLGIELARRVGPSGHVHGVDLNAAFLQRAEKNAAAAGLASRMTFHHIVADRVPLPEASVDRVICKNVLEYVDDVVATLADFRRVLKPAGLAHAIDSDWGMLSVEPIAPERLAQLFAAARVAYRTPLIGRKLYGFMRAAGFRDVRVKILAAADTRGFLAPIVFHMASYARTSERMDPSAIEALLQDIQRAIADETYLLVLPQFLVNGVA
jgi:ubiquinone/menaquinone biosynthesis C-methylase UbiE